MHPNQLNVHCLKQLPETKQTKYECMVYFVCCSGESVVLQKNWERFCLCIIKPNSDGFCHSKQHFWQLNPTQDPAIFSGVSWQLSGVASLEYLLSSKTYS